MSTRLRIGIVIHRYGEEVGGGAAQHARLLAEHLIERYAVEVFTTCALDYTTWADHYPAGEQTLNGVTLHRFPVDQPRDFQASIRETNALMRRERTLAEEQAWLRRQGPWSTPLFAALDASEAEFDYFIFFTYLYATTVFGLPRVAHKALLVPTAHEEPFIDMPLFREVFHAPRMILYNTEAERRLVHNIWGNQGVLNVVVGAGVDLPPDVDPHRFRQRFDVRDPFLLYVGRLTVDKRVDELLDWFMQYKTAHPGPLKLLLMGKGELSLPAHADVQGVGFVSEQEKYDGMAAALALINPSQFESLSLVALESWLVERPLIANGRCTVLKEQTRRSQGGLFYTTYPEFERVITYLRNHPDVANQMGRNGLRFTHHTYRWDIILAKFQALFEVLQSV